MEVTPLQHDEVDTFITTWWASFATPGADMVMPMIYPRGLTPELHARLKNRVLSGTENDLASHCFWAKDTNTGEMLGVTWIGVESGQSRDAAQKDYERAIAKKNSGPQIEGQNMVLGDAFFERSFWAEFEIADGKPYMDLHLLAVPPQHQRRGVGTLLLKYGVAKADELGLPMTLAGALYGKGLYERYGFRIVRELGFDGRKYGGCDEAKHWAMRRPPRSIRD